MSDKYVKAIAELCEKLDTMIYFPYKKIMDNTNFGHQKEVFKQEIEREILKLRMGKEEFLKLPEKEQECIITDFVKSQADDFYKNKKDKMINI